MQHQEAFREHLCDSYQKRSSSLCWCGVGLQFEEAVPCTELFIGIYEAHYLYILQQITYFMVCTICFSIFILMVFHSLFCLILILTIFQKEMVACKLSLKCLI